MSNKFVPKDLSEEGIVEYDPFAAETTAQQGPPDEPGSGAAFEEENAAAPDDSSKEPPTYPDGGPKRQGAGQKFTEDQLALSFCKTHPKFRYVDIWRRWLIWDGKRWIEDDTLKVYDTIRTYVRKTTSNNKEFTKATSIAAIEKLARSDRRYAATTDQWDENDWTINTQNGIVDLKTGEVKPHDRFAYHRKITAFGVGGDCPIWHPFLSDITGGDPEYVAFIQRMLGYALTGSTQEHALFFLYGTGSNGKSTLLNVITHILGDYAVVSSTDTFTESKTDRHPTDMAMLQGARLVIAQEIEEGRAWAEAKLKMLTGGDRVTARFMKKDFFTYVPNFKLLIASNHKPRLKNVDEAMRRRLHLLPFVKQFKGAKRDKELEQKLIAEGGGILKWMNEGCREYLRKGLDPPKIVSSATQEYFESENLFGSWLDECCERGAELREPSAKLFNSWKEYAKRANEHPGNTKSFADRLESLGFQKVKRSVIKWEGLQLKPGESNNEQHWQDN